MEIKIGVDEAGRGPWAGPVFAGIVILDSIQESLLHNFGVTDSKKITEKKREQLFPIIIENSIYHKVKYLSAEQIDKVGIYKATIILIESLVKELDYKLLKIKFEDLKILIDGVFPKIELVDKEGNKVEHKCIIKGDQLEPSISAASILAKVKRDHYMIKLSEKYPNYCFDKHKGYGTKLHLKMLEKYGICIEHRKSFKPVANIK